MSTSLRLAGVHKVESESSGRGGDFIRTRREVLSRGAMAIALFLFRHATAARSASAPGRLGKLRLRIEAGSAPSALTEFVRQTGLQVLFEFDAIRGHTTRAVNGLFDAAEALTLMLEGSGLIFEFVNDRTITVRPQAI